MAIRYRLNGTDKTFDGSPLARLLDVLRYEERLTGTKEGCGEGECGACTVLLDDEPVCACLVPMLQVNERAVRTVEGLAATEQLQPLQAAFVEEAGVQCGACTPGILVTTQALLERDAKPSRQTLREHLAGNLCRCTGYSAILRAVEAATTGGESDA